jgi:hypothetical protein
MDELRERGELVKDLGIDQTVSERDRFDPKWNSR